MAKFTAILFSSLMTASSFALGADNKEATPPAMSPEQQAMMEAYDRAGAVREEHKLLAYFVGNWAVKTTMWMDPKAPPHESAGKAKVEALFDGRYYTMQHDGDFGGQPFKGQGMFGFENTRGQFWNTWLDSMSTGIWLAYGTYDKASKTWTYRGEMADPMKPSTMLKVRQVVHITDEKHYVFEWYEIHDGKEAKTMQIDYTRQ